MPKPYHLIQSILHEPWAISEQACYSLTPLVASLFNSNIDFETGASMEPYSEKAGYYDDDQVEVEQNLQPEQQKTVQVIPIIGALTKQDQSCGPVGMETIGRWMLQAINDPSIDAIVLKFDSPGGTIAGMETLGNIIKSCSKPKIAHIDDVTCSAALYLACCCDEIHANNTTAFVGSIGVLMTYQDMKKYWEDQGIINRTITATRSKDKNKMYEDIQQGKYEEYRKTVLDPLCDKFIDHVKASRGDIDPEKYFTGKTYFAGEVMVDLVDQIGSLKFSIERAAQLASKSSSAKSSSKPSSTASLKTTDITMKLPLFAKAANVDVITASQTGTVSITETAAQSVEKQLEAHEATEADLRQQLKTSQESASDYQKQLQARTDQQTRITELEGNLQTANARIAELEKEPGANTATVDPNITGGGSGEVVETMHSRMARCMEILND